MRLQLALNVPDVEAAVSYYQKLFGIQVSKRKPGYANFEIEQPPLKLVLFEQSAPTDRLNHLGVEVFSHEEVAEAEKSQRNAGLSVERAEQNQCCYAKQDKAISYAPDGTMWEWYLKLDDLDGFASTQEPVQPKRCC